ncbi:MAG: DNA polymerase III subunit gamma/tau [Pyrinomonadaceae bacterium]
MSYQVIARKWRPQAFEEVTGQEPITRTLRGAIENDRLHHAYLFSGARGVGKTTTARLLAKALNCHKADCPTPRPCKTTDADQCASCREIAEGRSIDVLEIDAASNTQVENVREVIINTIGIAPARDRFKVFIIDEVHMLSGHSFNALLKTIEEPPPRVIFIMATTEAHKVPDTILSRCQQFEFRTIATQKIVERLKLIADAEGVRVADAALREIARAGEGSMRDAQSAFDQVISFSEGEIEIADVEAALGIAGAELRARVMRAVAEASPKETLAVVDDLVMRGHDLRNFCRDMLAHVRDLLVLKAAGDSAELVDASEAERKELVGAAKEFSESDLVRFFHSLTDTERELREGAHPRYQLEIGLVKLIEMRRLAPVAQILERLGALEETLRTGHVPAATAPSGGSAPPSSPQRGSGPATMSGPANRSFAGQTDAPAVPISTPPTTPPANSSKPAPPAANAPQPIPAPSVPSPAVPADGDASPLLIADMKPDVVPFADAFSGSNANPSAYADAPFWDAPRPSGPPPTPPLRLVPTPETNEGPPLPAAGAQSSASAPSAFGEPPAWDQTSAPVDSLREQLKRALEEKRKPLLAIALDDARRVRIDGDELSVEFAPDKKHLRDSLAKPDNTKLLRDVCRELLARDVGVRVVVNDGKSTGRENGGDGGPAPPPTRDDEERLERQRLRVQAEQNPLVQQLIRTFRAEIVDVRRVEGDLPIGK